MTQHGDKMTDDEVDEMLKDVSAHFSFDMYRNRAFALFSAGSSEEKEVDKTE